MRSEWFTGTIGDAFELVNGYAFKSSEFIDHGLPVIKIKNIKAGYFSEHEFSYVDPAYVNKRPEKVAKHDDLLISMSGNRHDGSPETWVGKVALFRKSSPYMINQRVGALRVKDKKSFDPRYMAYLLSSWPFQSLFIAIATSSGGQANLSPKQIYDAPIEYPDLYTQRAIAHILGTLDDKIELNRQINTTLEAMAQALFKSWFVDFDPVIDNALAAGNPIPEALQARAQARARLGDQRKPLPEDIRKQFPDRFVLIEDMGWVPEGWKRSSVGNEFDVTMGQSPPGDTYNEDGIGTPFFQGRTDFGFRYPTNRIYCTSPQRMASKGDTLVSVRAPVGDVNMAAENCCIGRGLSASRHKSGSRSFTYYGMQHLREHFKVYEGEGTVFGSINQKDFNALPQLAIPAELISSFDLQARNLDEKIDVTTQAINTLEGLRDLLLPKLLSGQIRIPETEKQMTEAL